MEWLTNFRKVQYQERNMKPNKELGKLLSEGVRSVANRQRKKIGDVQWDIGDQLGFTGYMAIW
jgi:hypothetical protein